MVLNRINGTWEGLGAVTTLIHKGFFDQVLVSFGCDFDRLPTLRRPNPPTALNPRGKDIISLTEDFFRRQLLPGPTFDILVDRYRAALNELLGWDRLTTLYPMIHATRTKPISLYDLWPDLMINATQGSFSGSDSNMTTGLRTFTDEFWKLLRPIRIRRLLQQAWLETYKELGVHEDDQAAMLVMIYWA
ncbi:hypothetical protein BO70DRAFT_394295 [Aspergillus heteromorphus CBS 117.55]|uniref:Uncharacterized protein n=1 Tax=Aspergillus heteromorphus CBS 117.55 TaxID=1448321 RepID=A0A317WLN1_9EURO|nr:uncharacterized protein BO70DRAFT_394295 [Aspergillus heteromorphus CBS 117.55]PWY87406.1 hypothetical protein BO70DRAFT_394295 [Aspergillus heteromorphus CBS 117.55]